MLLAMLPSRTYIKFFVHETLQLIEGREHGIQQLPSNAGASLSLAVDCLSKQAAALVYDQVGRLGDSTCKSKTQRSRHGLLEY